MPAAALQPCGGARKSRRKPRVARTGNRTGAPTPTPTLPRKQRRGINTYGRGVGAGVAASLTPHLARRLDDEAELFRLLPGAQRIAIDGRGEAALRAEAQLLERHVFRRLVDAALQFVL